MDETKLSVLTYSVHAPVQFETKASGQANLVNVLCYNVYQKNEDGQYIYMSDMSDCVEITTPSDIEVPVSLIQDHDYKLVFLAQYRCLSQSGEYINTYDLDEDTAVMILNEAAQVTDCEQLDAFVYVDEVRAMGTNMSRKIELERPFAQINFATSNSLPQSLDVSVENVPASYNIFLSTCSEQTTALRYSSIIPVGGTITVGSIAYNHLTSLYVFGGNKVNCTLACDGIPITINEVDTAPNHKTNIVGNI